MPELASQLRPWQLTGKEKLKTMARGSFHGGILADEPGMGKSLTAIVAALEIRLETGGGFILIVCPEELIEQWESELETHFKEVFHPTVRYRRLWLTFTASSQLHHLRRQPTHG